MGVANEIILGIKIGFFMSLILIIAWFLYGLFVYRFSNERIGMYAVNKYKAQLNPDDITDEEITAGKITTTTVGYNIDMNHKDKETLEILRTVKKSYEKTPNCNPMTSVNCLDL